MWFLIIAIAACIGLFYYWFTLKFDHFAKLGVPGPKPSFPFGNTPSAITMRRNFVYDVDDIYREFKGKAPFVGYFETKSPAILLMDPEIIKLVHVTNFKNFHDNAFSKMTDKDVDPIFGRNPFMLRGEEWKEKRAEITPAFTPSRIKALFPLVEEILDRLTSYINDELKKGNNEPFNGREVCAKYTTDVVSSCIFDADAQSFTKEKPEIREMGRKILQFDAMINLKFIMLAIFPVLKSVCKIKFVKKETEQFFSDLMYQAVKNRENTKIKRDDYLAYLIALKDKKNFSDMDMAAYGVTFFIDGFDTSSVAITNALYELAANKIVQEKLRKEIIGIFDANGRIDYDKMINNEYLDQVFHEALRLHPPAIITNRECTESFEFEGVKGKKYQVKVGESLNIPIYSIQRDPEFYPEPEKFMPERFNPEFGGVKAFKDKGVFLAFGDGPRICLGMRFALMQSKAAIANIVHNFEITVNDKTQQPVIIDPKEFINAKAGGTWLDFKPINT